MPTKENKNKLKDYSAGYLDAKSGYYDKWYRYNRLDEGYAYDRGFKAGKEKYDRYINIIEGRG